MSLRGFFVAGTDTGVGKTAFTAAFLCRMFDSGLRPAPVKPVQTGVAPDEPGDLDIALAAAGLSPSGTERRLMNPYRFRLPASPHLAAEHEGTTIDPALIIASCRELSRVWDCLLVESAGGLLVPLTRDYLSLDLARELGLPLIVLARAGLGTINHTLLTLTVARSAGLDVAAVALNRPEPSALDEAARLIETDNRRVIEETGGVTVIGPLPHVPGAGVSPEASRELGRALDNPVLERLLAGLG